LTKQTFAIISSKQGFEDYKASIEINEKSTYKHCGIPQIFPCLVHSLLIEEPGITTCYHGYLTRKHAVEFLGKTND